jgi:lycopene cyclase domain-containing protein
VLKSIAPKIFLIVGLTLLAISIIYRTKLYTGITFSLAGISCLYMAWKKPLWSGRFLLSYIVCWLPFLFVNGALTGNFTQNAIVNYNKAEIIGLRITTIPVEDSIYNLLMLLLVITVYERSK